MTNSTVQTIENLKALISEMSEGNPGAINVCCVVSHRFPSPVDAIAFLQRVKDSGTVGGAIWILYKDKCECDNDRFIQFFQRGCPLDCGHSHAQHKAFDAGLEAGTQGVESDDCPYSDEATCEAWLSGHSVNYRPRREQ